MPITVLLTDDKEVVRHSIQLLLGSEPEIRIVWRSDHFSADASARYRSQRPQIVLMDLHLPDDSSVNPQELKSLLNTLGARLIAISFWDDEATQTLADSFGAAILLDKLTLATELIPAIKAATLKQRSASA